MIKADTIKEYDRAIYNNQKLALLKKMSRERHKSIWLVSHKDEHAGRVENILKVVKENGFTSYNTDVDIA
jgi:ABC-type thiamine transport system ATPase subunit